MSENGEIYTAGKNFTLPPAVTAWTNSTWACDRNKIQVNVWLIDWLPLVSPNQWLLAYVEYWLVKSFDFWPSCCDERSQNKLLWSKKGALEYSHLRTSGNPEKSRDPGRKQPSAAQYSPVHSTKSQYSQVQPKTAQHSQVQPNTAHWSQV